ncbi:hypothetical protein AVEN_113983-1 [Araneus ventricosus]|uniref:Uncharacterized protein n=1 Tax=Araneus ventricosus TaxID=182803 RepID=A0A4Y2K092_ARAVE|nr:hypothetical protein AVEN_113983-1 [Araneus ventricosus]
MRVQLYAKDLCYFSVFSLEAIRTGCVKLVHIYPFRKTVGGCCLPQNANQAISFPQSQFITTTWGMWHMLKSEYPKHFSCYHTYNFTSENSTCGGYHMLFAEVTSYLVTNQQYHMWWLVTKSSD